jgi:hypothetical protein
LTIARLSAFQDTSCIRLLPGRITQTLNGAQETGMRVFDRATREAREQFGHSLAREMGLNPSFFKAGAGGGEV